MNHQDNNRLDIMSDELESIKAEIASMKTVLNDVYTLLAGNPIDKESSGLIGNFKSMQKEVYDLKAEVRKYKSYFYALVTLIGIGFLKLVIDFLSKK
jgi:hypothetical protein